MCRYFSTFWFMFYSFLTSPQIVGLSMQPVLLPNHYNSHFNMYVYMYTFLGIESRTIIFDKSSNLPYLIIIIVKGASISQHYFASYHFSSSLFKINLAAWDLEEKEIAMECKNIMKTMCFDINNKYHHFPQDDYDQERGVERGWDRHWRRGAVNGSLSLVAQPTYCGTLWHIVRIAVGWLCEGIFFIQNFKKIPINNLVCCFLFACLLGPRPIELF